MSGDMVRAILEGRKTQTRRVMRPTKPNEKYIFNHDHFKKNYKFKNMWHDMDNKYCAYFHTGPTSDSEWGFAESFECPYGQPGDRLWVREKFAQTLHGTVYAADNNGWGGLKWSPSIHMPRWDSRITLEITGVRVERLQGISEDGAQSEGITTKGFLDDIAFCNPKNPIVDHPSARDAFIALWESINGAKSWAANPWVWAISFKRVEAAA